MFFLMKKIKFCCRNFDKHGSKSVYKTLKIEYPELKKKKKDCLGVCKHCTKQCMALIGKTEIVVAPSPEALYEKLKQRIG
ncbi:uncharacterized protein DUF1450 [Cohnella phaseoli]|uniref:Uncharacterized protein DUF1450 n=2 Tax=Paenibacillaceae TaxID=186822 RepID=A0A3D9KK12_9BACL|nr:uncharacterized protein DUF1450 [Cohnella phaseoli]